MELTMTIKEAAAVQKTKGIDSKEIEKLLLRTHGHDPQDWACRDVELKHVPEAASPDDRMIIVFRFDKIDPTERFRDLMKEMFEWQEQRKLRDLLRRL